MKGFNSGWTHGHNHAGEGQNMSKDQSIWWHAYTMQASRPSHCWRHLTRYATLDSASRALGSGLQHISPTLRWNDHHITGYLLDMENSHQGMVGTPGGGFKWLHAGAACSMAD